MLYCFVAIYGFCHAVRAVAVFRFVGPLFRGRALGEVIGTVLAGANVAGAIEPYVAVHAFVFSGSYAITIIAAGFVLTLTALATMELGFEQREA